MKRLVAMSLASALTIGITAACSQISANPVSITSTESLVNGCQKLGEVAATAKTPDIEVNVELSDAARAKGANFILVPAQGARSGVAYRCGMPSVATK